MTEFRADYPTQEERRLMADVEKLGAALAAEHDDCRRLTAELAEMKKERDSALRKSIRLHIENVNLSDSLAEARDLLNWIVHLHHGVSKGGPEFEPPCDQEWNDCLDQCRAAIDDDVPDNTGERANFIGEE